MPKNYYCLNLDDYSAPGFCTLSKSYFGSLPDISLFVASLVDNQKTAINFAETIKAYNAFISGNQNVMHPVGYHKEQFLTPVQLLHESSFVIKNYFWRHLNIWGFEYFMYASEINVSQILIKKQYQIIRCVKPVFIDLRCHTEDTKDIDKYLKIDHFWGFPNIYKYDKDEQSIVSRLYQSEKCYDEHESMKEMMAAAYEDIKDTSSVTFSYCLDDIFGDG